MADIQHIFTGASDPATTPTGLGHHFVNTATGVTWESVGTTTVGDWKRNPAITSGTGAPVSTPSAIGDMYIDVTLGSEVPYTAVHITDATGWSLGGGGGGGSSGPVSTDFANYTFVGDGTTQSIALDITKQHHRITLDRVGLASGGALEIVLPNATDLAEVDYSADVFFSIIVHADYQSLDGGRFDLLSSVGIKVNGQALYTDCSDQPAATSTHMMAIAPHGTGFDLVEVRSTLWIEARLISNGVYAMTFLRDDNAQVAG